MQITKQNILNKWTEYTLTNDHNESVSILNYGATITKWLIPNEHGKLENIVLSYDDVAMYKENPLFLGSVIGRVAGRIKQAQFSVDQKAYQLEQNDGENHLHGGSHGLHHHLWDVEPFQEDQFAGVRLKTKALEEIDGYPGNVEITVTYTLDNDHQLSIEYEAETDQTTPLALTNHTYFNLSGDATRTVEEHELKFNSSHILELDSDFIPTGRWLETANTPFDFSQGRKLESGMAKSHEQNAIVGNGYDHYFLFDQDGAVQITDSQSNKTLNIMTNQPGMILYTGNSIDENIRLNGSYGKKYMGVCVETQGHPASLFDDNLPTILLKPDERYYQLTTFKISN